MKDNIEIIVYVIAAIVTIALSLWITKAVWYSDMPMWLKWALLK